MTAFPSAAPASSPAKRMVAKINKVRRASGHAPLRYSPSLTRSSKRYGRKLIRADRFGHASRIQASSAFRSLGEVLAFHGGWRSRISGTVRQWMHSSGHRRVLMSSMRQIGAGRARGRFGGRMVTIWVVQVGRR